MGKDLEFAKDTVTHVSLARISYLAQVAVGEIRSVALAVGSHTLS